MTTTTVRRAGLLALQAGILFAFLGVSDSEAMAAELEIPQPVKPPNILSHFFYWEGPNRHDLFRNGQEIYKHGRFFGDLIVEEASRFMEQNRSQPSFVYFALDMPHYPYQGEPKWLERFKDLPYPRNLYAAFVATLDERIGAVLKKVDDLSLRERTLVIYQSDNGHSTEQRAHSGGGSAGPYRGAKFSLFEGGIRLPAIISWPGQLPEGQVRDQIVHACDWMPTIAELASDSRHRSAVEGLQKLL